MRYDEYDGPSRERMSNKPKRLSWAEKQEQQAEIDAMHSRRVKARNREDHRRRSKR